MKLSPSPGSHTLFLPLWFALLAVLSVNTGRAEQWTFTNVSGTAWSTAANWTENAPGSPVPPGTAGNTYTNVRLNINGLVDYSAVEGTQTYDVSTVGGETRGLVVGATNFNSAKRVTLSGTGANLVFIPESGLQSVLVGAGIDVFYTGQASLIVDNGATLKIQTAGGAVAGDLAVLTRGTATARGTLTVGGTGAGAQVSADRVTFGGLSAPSVGAVAVLNLNAGGTLLTRQVVASANSNTTSYVTVNFHGGTLRAADTNHGEIWVSGSNGLAVQLLSGGGTLDTNGQNGQTVSAVISGTVGGALTKSGLGTLILTAANTYDGGTVVSAGTLLVNNATGSGLGTGGITVGFSGTLGGTGFLAPLGTNGITIGGVLAPGASIGTLTLDLAGTTGGVTMLGTGAFEFELGAANVSLTSIVAGSSDLLVLAGASAGDFVFSGNAVDFEGTGEAGYYKLFQTSLDASTWAGLTFDGTTGVVSAGLTASNLAGGLSGTFVVGTAGNGGDLGAIYVYAVPEPSAAILVLGSLFGLVRRRHRA